MLTFDRVSHRYDTTPTLADISFTAAAGEITCLVGPSGCGKTTLLRLAAGLLRLQAGQIELDGRLLANADRHVPPEQRAIGLVFQEGALFPHLSVRRNVEFGLSGTDTADRAERWLREVGLSGFAGRYPDSLSGGQRQRVALARAMAPEPAALLFDEPFANIDIELRKTLRTEARRLVKERGTVGVVVTHDPDEVLAMSDRVVVMDTGRIVQQGTPRDLYEQPASLGVAMLFGQAQRLSATLSGDSVTSVFGTWPRRCLQTDDVPDGEVDVVVRPYDLVLHEGGDLTVADVRLADGYDEYVLRSPATDAALIVAMPIAARDAAESLAVGSQATVQPRNGRVFVQPASS
ncbi:MAG: ABC transporter ATP-binding protein [Pseudomonadota bacterium]